MKPALVLLHGAVLNHCMWDPVVAELRREFRIVAPDLPGHGRHEVGVFSLDAAARTVVDASRSVGSSQVVLVGDSLGAYVALHAAPRLGAQLAGAVLGGCTADFGGWLGWLFAARGALTKFLSPEKVMTAAARRIGADSAWARKMLDAGVRPAAFGEAVTELRKFDLSAALARVDAPVLLVNGTRDWPNRVGEARAIGGHAHVSMEHFPDVGHGVSLFEPHEFAQTVREFAENLEPAAARAAA